eukprot:479823-Rhodomonas_salina.1
MTEQLEAAQERIVELSVAVGRAEERREAQGERWKEKLALKDEEILRLRAHGEARGGSNLDHADSAGRVDVEMQREVERLRARVRELEAELAGLEADQARSGPGQLCDLPTQPLERTTSTDIQHGPTRRCAWARHERVASPLSSHASAIIRCPALKWANPRPGWTRCRSV